MKNKYGFWKLCFNSLAGLASLAGLIGLTGCKKLVCDFSYTPTLPAAGSVVTFSNMSTGADDYYWTFGDNSTSTTSSPTHIYRKPGTYTVTLQIKRNKVEKRERTQTIMVIDTIPTIACDTDSVYAFSPTTFSAQVYNPWKKSIDYKWTIPSDAVVLYGKSLDSSAIVCYFNQSSKASLIQLSIQMGNDVHQPEYNVPLYHQPAPSVLFYNASQATEQFTYTINKQIVFSASSVTSSSDNISLLQNEQDSVYLYGDTLFTVARVQKLINQSIRGFQVDRLANKIYAYGDGLWVSDMTGKFTRCLQSTPVQALKVDGDGNRFYWSTATGLYCHRLLGTQMNKDDFQPEQVNTYTNISRISVNSNLH